MSTPIKVKLTWHTAFDTEAELQEFLDEVAGIHARRYGTNVAYNALSEDGFYNGTRNFIRTNITRKEPINELMDEFKINEHVNIKKYAGDEYNSEGRVAARDDKKGYYVQNMNMPFMGTVSDWFKADELEHQ